MLCLMAWWEPVMAYAMILMWSDVFHRGSCCFWEKLLFGFTYAHTAQLMSWRCCNAFSAAFCEAVTVLLQKEISSCGHFSSLLLLEVWCCILDAMKLCSWPALLLGSSCRVSSGGRTALKICWG
ncbi:hypothetical protein Nepgr_031334 [Nepenthes gracilis]|uniref:Uncharacterized protein n=1 Tax=Nepenthes gracilis TaxID=150966 RepID=A0AAD3Y7F5_NEPGR|nr:hypothetical protein Nepgr_031334 [Nepenthes gracilis]